MVIIANTADLWVSCFNNLVGTSKITLLINTCIDFDVHFVIQIPKTMTYQRNFEQWDLRNYFFIMRVVIVLTSAYCKLGICIWTPCPLWNHFALSQKYTLPTLYWTICTIWYGWFVSCAMSQASLGKVHCEIEPSSSWSDRDTWT